MVNVYFLHFESKIKIAGPLKLTKLLSKEEN